MLALLAGIHSAAAQGTTAFTYQGQLRDGGTNANGTYGMTFKLYDAVSAGNQIGSSLVGSVILSNGLFSVNLDFGANVFTNTARWLDITVTNSGVSQTLAPRVQVLPTPFATYAALAGNINGTLLSAQLGGSYSNVVNFNNPTNSFGGTFTGNGNGVTNIASASIVGLTNVINNTVTYKAAVQAATTNGLPNYSNNISGSIIGTSFGALTIDGITLQLGDSVLVKNETGGATNGIYVCTTTGSASAGYVLTRRSDFNSATSITAGDTVLVLQGGANTNTVWTLTTAGPITVGTTPLTFVKISDATIPSGQVFGTNGTFIVPAGVTKISVEMWGGGGGGGGSYTNAGGCQAYGGGGGGGSYSRGIFTVTPGTSYAATIGNGGAGGLANAGSGTGGDGGTTSLGALLSASGGFGGGNAPNPCLGANQCGNSGSGSNGGYYGGVNFSIGGGNGQSGCSDGTGGSGALGGTGGFGHGGGDGSKPGGGGGGADPNNTANGGNGGKGFILIYY
jgi:hypothetical protein